MKKLHIGIVTAAVIAVLSLGAGTVWLLQKEPAKMPATEAATTQTQSKPAERSRGQYVVYDGQDGKNALQLLKESASVETKDSAYGPYVDSVNGVKGGTDGKYWTFYVNGKMASVGAEAYQSKTGDKIEWKLE